MPSNLSGDCRKRLFDTDSAFGSLTFPESVSNLSGDCRKALHTASRALDEVATAHDLGGSAQFQVSFAQMNAVWKTATGATEVAGLENLIKSRPLLQRLTLLMFCITVRGVNDKGADLKTPDLLARNERRVANFQKSGDRHRRGAETAKNFAGGSALRGITEEPEDTAKPTRRVQQQNLSLIRLYVIYFGNFFVMWEEGQGGLGAKKHVPYPVFT